MSFTMPLPATRSTGGTSTADPAADVNLLSAALGEARSRAVRVANLSTATLASEALAAVTAGLPLVLPAGAVITVTSRQNMPAGLVLVANDAEVRGQSATGDFLLAFGPDTTVVGHLRVRVAAGTNVRGVSVGANNRIDALTVTAPSPGAGAGDLDDVAVLIGASAHIGAVSVSNFDRPYKITGATGVDIGYLAATTYVRGLYVTDSRDVTVHAGLMSGTSPNASISAGHNGVLIDATDHDLTSGLRFNNITVRDAGEHGYRIGGNKRVKDVRFTDCAAINVGGCGFKVLGGTVADSNYHHDIWLTNPYIEDAGQTVENASGVQLELVRRAKVINPTIRRRLKPYAAGFGVQIQAGISVDVVNPDVSDTLVAGYAVRGTLGNSSDVRLAGGRLVSATGDIFRIDYTGREFRRVSIEGHPQADTNGTGYILNVTNTSGGAIVGGSWLTWQSVSAAARQVTGLLPGYLCDARAPFTGNPNFKPGSTWTDPDTGARRTRVAAAWVAQAPVQIVDAATHDPATEVDGILYVGA